MGKRKSREQIGNNIDFTMERIRANIKEDDRLTRAALAREVDAVLRKALAEKGPIRTPKGNGSVICKTCGYRIRGSKSAHELGQHHISGGKVRAAKIKRLR